MMFNLVVFSLCIWSVSGYFTLPGKCPENVSVQADFNLAEFYGKWYQAYFYSSNGLRKNNCSMIDVSFKPGLGGRPIVFFNQSRVDRGLFHRYSQATVSPPKPGSESANLELRFQFLNAPRRLMQRNYQFKILATNYNYYTTAYTCQYSPLIDKHFVYIWILSRNPILNDVSKELALKPLRQMGVEPEKLVKDDRSKCNPKYYDNVATEPTTFRYPVPIY